MSDQYHQLKEHFSGRGDVVVASGRGAQGLKHGKKMFAMFYKGDLLLQLPPDRVSQLVESEVGLPYDPGTGSAMANRVLIPQSNQDRWVELCEEALAVHK
jgi:hypothetical protein